MRSEFRASTSTVNESRVGICKESILAGFLLQLSDLVCIHHLMEPIASEFNHGIFVRNAYNRCM
jgi:hypothetical protein